MVETLHQLYHDSPMAGHVRIHETLYRVSEHCFFKRMDPIFTECVRLCPDCQKCKITNHHTKSQYIAHHVPHLKYGKWIYLDHCQYHHRDSAMLLPLLICLANI